MTPRIPLSAPDITQAEVDAVTRVLQTPFLSLGPELQLFEDALAAYHHVPHAVAVSSGTAGLHLALMTLKIGSGDEVIVPSFTFIAVANAVLQVGATPVLVDIDPVTMNMQPAAVEEAITPHTRAMIVVHTFGVPAEMDDLTFIARRHKLLMIEDACEALGAAYGSGTAAKRVGRFGDLAVFGFYPNKQITTGEGGAVLASNPSHALRLQSLRNQGRRPDAGWLDHAETGFNYRLPEMACALGRVQLSRIERILACRQSVAKRYHELLGEIEGLELPALELPQRTISWFVFVVRLPQRANRERVQDALAAHGIATGRYFAPVHLQPSWKSRQQDASRPLPVTESIARRSLALPFFNRLQPEQQQAVADALREVLSSAGSPPVA